MNTHEAMKILREEKRHRDALVVATEHVGELLKHATDIDKLAKETEVAAALVAELKKQAEVLTTTVATKNTELSNIHKDLQEKKAVATDQHKKIMAAFEETERHASKDYGNTQQARADELKDLDGKIKSARQQLHQIRATIGAG